MTNGNFYDAVKSLGAERSRAFVYRWVCYPVVSLQCIVHRQLFKLLEVAHGVEYLHKHNVVHGDLRGVSSQILFMTMNLC